MIMDDKRTHPDPNDDVIWPSLLRHSWSGDYEFPNTKQSMKIYKDWTWKFKRKVNEMLVPRAIKQWRFLKGYGMKDCKLLDLRESIHSAKLIIIIFRESYMQQFGILSISSCT